MALGRSRFVTMGVASSVVIHRTWPSRTTHPRLHVTKTLVNFTHTASGERH